jgi:hypothetical protein
MGITAAYIESLLNDARRAFDDKAYSQAVHYYAQAICCLAPNTYRDVDEAMLMIDGSASLAKQMAETLKRAYDAQCIANLTAGIEQ